MRNGAGVTGDPQAGCRLKLGLGHPAHCVNPLVLFRSRPKLFKGSLVRGGSIGVEVLVAELQVPCGSIGGVHTIPMDRLNEPRLRVGQLRRWVTNRPGCLGQPRRWRERQNRKSNSLRQCRADNPEGQASHTNHNSTGFPVPRFVLR